MKTTMYRVSLNTTNSTCESMAKYACLNNGKSGDLTLADLVGYFKTQKLYYPTSDKDLKLSLIDNTLLVDETTGSGTINLLKIEQIEIIEDET